MASFSAQNWIGVAGQEARIGPRLELVFSVLTQCADEARSV
jgi:hypothetical protein